MEESKKQRILLNLNLNDKTLVSLRLYQPSLEVMNKVVLLYADCYNKEKSTFVCLLNGSKIGPAIASQISLQQLDKLSTVENPEPTEEQPIKYKLYIDENYTLQTGLWELFMGDMDNPNNQKTYFYNNKLGMLAKYNAEKQNYKSAYYIHHFFPKDKYVSDTQYKELH